MVGFPLPQKIGLRAEYFQAIYDAINLRITTLGLTWAALRITDPGRPQQGACANWQNMRIKYFNAISRLASVFCQDPTADVLTPWGTALRFGSYMGEASYKFWHAALTAAGIPEPHSTVKLYPLYLKRTPLAWVRHNACGNIIFDLNKLAAGIDLLMYPVAGLFNEGLSILQVSVGPGGEPVAPGGGDLDTNTAYWSGDVCQKTYPGGVTYCTRGPAILFNPYAPPNCTYFMARDALTAISGGIPAMWLSQMTQGRLFMWNQGHFSTSVAGSFRKVRTSLSYSFWSHMAASGLWQDWRWMPYINLQPDMASTLTGPMFPYIRYAFEYELYPLEYWAAGVERAKMGPWGDFLGSPWPYYDLRDFVDDDVEYESDYWYEGFIVCTCGLPWKPCPSLPMNPFIPFDNIPYPYAPPYDPPYDPEEPSAPPRLTYLTSQVGHDGP